MVGLFFLPHPPFRFENLPFKAPPLLVFIDMNSWTSTWGSSFSWHIAFPLCLISCRLCSGFFVGSGLVCLFISLPSLWDVAVLGIWRIGTLTGIYFSYVGCWWDFSEPYVAGVMDGDETMRW